jgi:hypothetical protein
MKVDILIKDGVVVTSADGPVYFPRHIAVSEGDLSAK